MERVRVLLIDDEQDFLQVLAVRLRRRGLDVVTADSARAGLEHLADAEVDVVVLDVRMPGEDGIEALQQIRARHPGVEVLILTGFADHATSLRVGKLGAFDYLMKPAAIEELVERIAAAHRHGTHGVGID